MATSMGAVIAHGGSMAAARRRFPDAPGPPIDLSTGINPFAFPLPALPLSALARLPDPEEVAALETLAAQAYGAPDESTVAAPGTQALIHLLPRLLPPQTVAILSPTYAEHRAAWAAAGHAVREVATLDEAAEAGVAVLVRPNNPDGQVADRQAVLRLADRFAARSGLLVVDEAFADLEGCSLAGALPRPGLLLLRSFGKTYGLAGVRLGFALTAPALAARLRDALGPWAVSGPALHAGLHGLADSAWRKAAAVRLAGDAAWLDHALRLAGCRVVGGTRLFRLAEHGDAAGLAGRLGKAGILVRQFAERPGLLRFGLPGPVADWVRLHEALA